MSDYVEIFEVGPRDGLQNEKRFIPTKEKVALIDLLSQAGFRRIEVASFVSPKWVPQMADGAQILGAITRGAGIRYAALTPNLQGYEGAIKAGADEVAIFASASEAFSKANINATIAESLERFRPLVEQARKDGIKLRGYVSCAIECPYQGAIDPRDVLEVAQRLEQMGCYEISLADTLGRAKPQAVARMLERVVPHIPPALLAGHYHDTAGRALENITVSLDHGLRVFDAAVGGLGGCPYAPGAAGNVATEAVARHVTALGYRTGLALDLVDRAAILALGMRAT